MKHFIRLTLVFVLAAAFLPNGSAAAIKPAADPVCAEVATSLGASYESIRLDGSVTCTMYPAFWNRDMVVFAHGYEDARKPVQIPWTQLKATNPSLPALVLNLGYAFATTSYSKNGLAVQEGVADIINLVDHVRQKNKAIQRVFLTGASEGGLVTELAIERYPQLFTGALSTCGPIGSFQGQVQYWGNFRVAFDKYFPSVLKEPQSPLYGPSTPIFIDPVVVQNWESIWDSVVLPQLASNPVGVEALLNETKVPVDSADPVNTAAASINQLLYYNTEATNDGRLTLVPGLNLSDLEPPSLAGNPYINPDYTDGYPGTGILPDSRATAEIQTKYETTGKLQKQVVVMHTTGDPVIPFNQSLAFLSKAISQGSFSKVTWIPITRYGHCNFQPAEIVFGFYVMVLRSTLFSFSAAQVNAALPDEQSRHEFNQLKEKHKDKINKK